MTLALVMQHVWQTIWFLAAVGWILIMDWRWVQSGFFIMHAISMLMKQHSYLSVNREMKAKDIQLSHLQHRRKNLISNTKKSEDSALQTIEIEIEDIDNEIEDLLLDLRNGKTQFPNNISFANFLDYLLVPTLVYELEYPRTER